MLPRNDIYLWHETGLEHAFNDIEDNGDDVINPDGYDWDEEEEDDE